MTRSRRPSTRLRRTLRYSNLRKRVEKARRRRRAPKVDLPEDPIEFWETVLKTKLYPYQAEFVQDHASLKVLRWCRRAGKTTVMSGEDIRFALARPQRRIIVTMPKFQQVKEIYFQGESGLHAHLERMPKKVYDDHVEEQLQTIIRFRNGSEILAETPEPFTIRGHGPSRISIDEFNFIRKDRDLWLSALLPMTLTKTVHVVVASTPWNKDSVYHKMCFDRAFKMFSGNVHEHDPPRYLKTWSDVRRPNGPLDPYQVEVMREQYAGDPWRWKREMECSFVDDETSFLPSSLIIKCQNEELEFTPFEASPVGMFYIGWDLGREHDHCVVAVVDRKQDFIQLIHCKQFPLGTPYVTVMAYIKSICDRWRSVQAVYYDHTGTKGMDEQIKQSGYPGVKGVDFTLPTKHSIAMNLKQRMMTPRKGEEGLGEDAKRCFELPYDQDVQAELNVVQWEQRPGSEIYSFSHAEGVHDDRFWAICLAVTAAVEAPLPSRPISRALG